MTLKLLWRTERLFEAEFGGLQHAKVQLGQGQVKRSPESANKTAFRGLRDKGSTSGGRYVQGVRDLVPETQGLNGFR